MAEFQGDDMRAADNHVACDLRPESILPCRSSFSQTMSTIIIHYYTRSTDRIARLVRGKVSALCLNMLGCSNGPTFINRPLPSILDLTLAIPQAQNGVDEVTQPLDNRQYFNSWTDSPEFSPCWSRGKYARMVPPPPPVSRDRL